MSLQRRDISAQSFFFSRIRRLEEVSEADFAQQKCISAVRRTSSWCDDRGTASRSWTKFTPRGTRVDRSGWSTGYRTVKKLYLTRPCGSFHFSFNYQSKTQDGVVRRSPFDIWCRRMKNAKFPHLMVFGKHDLFANPYDFTNRNFRDSLLALTMQNVTFLFLPTFWHLFIAPHWLHTLYLLSRYIHIQTKCGVGDRFQTTFPRAVALKDVHGFSSGPGKVASGYIHFGRHAPRFLTDMVSL